MKALLKYWPVTNSLLLKASIPTHNLDESEAASICLRQVQKLGLACSALEGCLVPARITDAGVRSLCRMTQLTSLDLSGHAAVSDRSILALAAHLTGLTALDLRKPACDATGSSGVSDEGIAALAGLSLLRTLRMSQVEVSYCCILGVQLSSSPLYIYAECKNVMYWQGLFASYATDNYSSILNLELHLRHCSCQKNKVVNGSIGEMSAGGKTWLQSIGRVAAIAVPGDILL